jgi:putative ABC transport system permease protein
MHTLRQDVRYALRFWRRRPGFALVGILTLALGVGANTAMFSIVNAVLLRPLPYAHADRLVTVWGRQPSNPRSLVAYREYEALRAQNKTFDALCLFLGQSVNLTGVSEPQRLLGNFISGSLFEVLSLEAERGRLFTDAESEPGAAKPVVVISQDFWARKFNQDESAIGATLTLNGNPLTVVGVLAPPFDARTAPADGFFLGYDVYIPAGLFPVPGGLATAGPSMLMAGRMKAGVALPAARADFDVITRRLEVADPKNQVGRSAFLEPAHETLVGESRTGLMLLLSAVGAVLLIACVNVSNLLLARAVDRQREIALRAALGASRLAVTRQMAVEASLLAGVSAGLGLLLGRWALQALTWLRPPNVPIPEHLALDQNVLLFTAGIAILIALMCGLAPALRASRPDLSRVLQTGFRRGSTGSRTRDVLVVAEITLSVTLLAVSGLIVQSLLALQHVNVGFDSANVLTLQFRLPTAKYPKPEDIARFFKQTIERVQGVAGVQSVALARRVPFSGNWGDTPFVVEGRMAAANSEPRAGQNMISPDYFRTMRIALLRGRDFTERDDLRAPPVVVVNQTLARTIWPGDDAVGKHIKVPESPEWLTVVGVVGDAKHRTATEPPQPQLYLAHYQVPLIFSSLVARTAVPPMSIANDVRRAVWSVDKDQPVWSVSSLDDIVARSHGSTRFLAWLLAIFSAVALVLAASGIYGVMSYSVTERTHEIGIRIALGASADRVMRDIVGRGLALTAVALVIGLAGAAVLGRLARGVLFGVTPGDPATLAGAAALLALVSLAACYIPARRAARVDPVVALAEE